MGSLIDIIFKVMDDFKSSRHYKDLYNKGSIVDWKKAIHILSDWRILNKETKEKYLELYKLRKEFVHYQKKKQSLDEIPAPGDSGIDKTGSFMITTWR